jgi:NADH-quinone oxidoreductase subunit A
MPGEHDYALIAIMVFVAVGVAAAILLLVHVVMPLILRHWRYGDIKHDTYESGVEPFGDTRRRFNVRFYLIAVLFLIFDVEIIFLWPFAVLFRRLAQAGQHLADGGTLATAPEELQIATMMINSGYTMSFFLTTIGFFSALLVVGLIYEWRKGIFQWD